MSALRTVYVEFGRDREPMAWQDGRLLGEDETAAREGMQVEFGRIVENATADLRAGDLRSVRAGDTLLVETRLNDGRPRLDATVIVERPVRVRWSHMAAQVAHALDEGGVAADQRRLRGDLVAAWRHTGSIGERLAAPIARLISGWRGERS